MSDALVTVVIPCFNHGAYVKKAVESVLKQNYPAIELLTYDDGSKDESPQILQSLSEKFGFFFQAQQNQGLTRTLNDALARANGKYFSMLSSDDYLCIDKIERLVEYMEGRPDIYLCGGGHLEIDASGRVLEKQRVLPYAELDFNDVFLLRKRGPSPVSMLARTEAIRKVGGYDESIRLEDIDMWLKLTHSGGLIARLNDVFGYYRKHDSNTYKNVRFMYESLMASYAKYKHHPEYENVVFDLQRSTLLKAARSDTTFARELIAAIPLKRFDAKVLRGVLRYLVK